MMYYVDLQAEFLSANDRAAAYCEKSDIPLPNGKFAIIEYELTDASSCDDGCPRIAKEYGGDGACMMTERTASDDDNADDNIAENDKNHTGEEYTDYEKGSGKDGVDKRSDDDMSDEEKLNVMLGTALDFDEITAARGFETNGKFVLALLSIPIFLKSERLALVKNITDEIADKVEIAPIVLIDTDLYRRIEDKMSEEEKQKLLKLAMSRSTYTAQ